MIIHSFRSRVTAAVFAAVTSLTTSASATTYGPECLADGGFENCQFLTSVKYAKIGTTDISSPSWTSGNVAKSGNDWLTGVTGLLQGSNCGCIWQYLKLECTFEANETGTYELSLLSAQRGTYGDAGHETMVSVDGGDPFFTFTDNSKTAQ